MKRIAFILFCFVVSLPSFAVLKEQDLASTLSVLRAELESSYREQKEMTARFSQRQEAQHQQMISIMQKSDEIALMLYSQQLDNTFDMTYACHEATEQYRDFSKRRMPYDRIVSKLNSEIDRYTNLINTLETLPPSLNRPALPPPGKGGPMPPRHQGAQPFMLNAQGQADRMACLNYAKALQRDLMILRTTMTTDNEHYKSVGQKLKKVNDYAIGKYNIIQHNIFVNGDDSYFKILSNPSRFFRSAKQDANQKYKTEMVSNGHGPARPVHSQWRGPIVIGLTVFILFYLIIAGALSNILIRWIVPKRYRTPEFMKKKVCLILAAAIVIFALSIMVVRLYMNHNFFLMASKLLIEFAWLMGAILSSLLIRLSGDQIKSGFKIYTPIMLMGFIVIAFRIVFIPNNLVQLIFPPILLLFTLWQWFEIRSNNKNIPRSDIFYTWISLTIMIISTATAWYGYTLLSVQIFIWWIFQLSCIQTITCVFDLLNAYEKKFLNKRIKASNESGKKLNENILKNHAAFINITWFFDFVSMVLVPVLGVASVLLSIAWAADVFDLTEAVFNVFMTNFVNIPNILQLSLFKIVLVAALWFVFRYLNYLIKATYHKYHRSKVIVNGKANFTLANNLIAIIIWGLYFIFSIKLLNIPSTAISIITAGLATGVGFAMKDLLENFFYGISLMTGRLRVGDFIECDGIRGKVDSITYQSTQIVTADGCIIAFLNSSLFSKNFKNLTKNHSYELVKIPVGIAYGTNVDDVRKLLVEAVKSMMTKNSDGRDIISSKQGINVIFDDFGDSSVNLFVTYWVLVEEKFAMTGKVKETIYNTLNDHHIDIPFPQREVRIRQ